MCFDWCFGTSVLPFYRDSTIPAVRDCVARKRSYTVQRFKARQFLFTRTPDPLRTRSVRRASDSVQTALVESGTRGPGSAWAIVRQLFVRVSPDHRSQPLRLRSVIGICCHCGLGISIAACLRRNLRGCQAPPEFRRPLQLSAA